MRDFLNKCRKFFTGKKMKYGTNAAILTVAFLAILVVINLIVGTFDWKKDLTKNQLFSFSDQTIKVLEGLNQPVNIFALYPQGQKDEFVMEVLERYDRESKHINVEVIDPVKNPGFTKKYDEDGKGIPNGSFIVEGEERFKIVRSYDLVNYNFQTQRVDSLLAEQRFTSAVAFATSEKVPALYFVQGHGEAALTGITENLETENYETEQLNLLTEAIPDNADAIIIASPKRDFAADEIEKLDTYFDKGGRAIFLFDIAKDPLPKLEAYLEEWGVRLNQDVVIEGDQNKFYSQPTYLLPDIQSHEITGTIKRNQLNLLIPVARSMEVLFEEKGSIKVNSLVKSSADSWGKTNFDSNTFQQEEGDLPGPLDIAVAITRPNYDEENNNKPLPETKILVVGNTAFLDSNTILNNQLANIDFFMNGLSWMQDQEDKITIRPKSLVQERMNITSQHQIQLYALLVVIVIPLIIFILGGVVWMRRRHL